MTTTINASTTLGLQQTADTSGVLALQTANTTALTLDASQNATFAGYVNAPNTFGFKNRIINGAMMIDQRNAGASKTTSDVYTVDRWAWYASQPTKFTWGQNLNSVTPPVGFSNYFGFQSSSSYSVISSDYFQWIQQIEGFNTADLAWGTANAKTVTLSFLVYSSLTGTFAGGVMNSASNRSYPFTFSITTANTWTQISVTIAGDTTGTWVGGTNGIGVSVRFNLGAGSNFQSTANTWGATGAFSVSGAVNVVGTSGATFYITGVQLEKGSTATSFDYRPYGTELSLCQRYTEVFRSTTGNYSPICGAYTINSTTGEATIQFKVEKRSAPTVTYDTASNFALAVSNTGGLAALSAISTNRADINAVAISCTSSGLVSGGGSRLFANNTANPYIIASSEL